MRTFRALSATLALSSGYACVSNVPSILGELDAGGSDAASPDTGVPQPGTDGGFTDAAPDAGGPPDAGGDAQTGRCDPNKPFGAPVLLGGVTSLASNQYEARLSPDERAIYFGDDRDPLTYIYSASRNDTSQPFGAPQPLNFANLKPSAPTVSGNQLTLVFQDNQPVSPPSIYLVTRDALNSAWKTPSLLPNLAGSAPAHAPYLLPDGKTLYYVSGAIKASTAAPNGDFPLGADVVGIASAAGDDMPAATPDQLTIYWSTGRTDTDAGKGGSEIWRAHRTSVGGAFTDVAIVPELNSPYDDRPSWVAADDCSVYLSSLRPAAAGVDGGGGQHVWVATRPL